MKKTIMATIAGLVLFATSAMAQVLNPSQITVQETGLFTKDSTSDSGATHSATHSGGLLVGYSYQFND